MKILGLDISSATIGWSTIEIKKDNIALLNYGHLKPPSKKKSKDNFSLRLNFAFEEVEKLIKSEKPDFVAIEDYAKKFSKGKSSAGTIIILAAFNEVCSLASYRVLKQKPIKIPVTRIRSLIREEYSKDIKDKEDVLNFCKKKFNNFLPQKNRVGNIKKESYDEADSIVVCLGYYLEHIK